MCPAGIDAVDNAMVAGCASSMKKRFHNTKRAISENRTDIVTPVATVGGSVSLDLSLHRPKVETILWNDCTFMKLKDLRSFRFVAMYERIRSSQDKRGQL